MSAAFNPMDLTGRRFVVTGAASGIGRATCYLLSKLGANLVMIDVNENGLKETKAKCKITDEIIEFDLLNTSAIKDLILNINTAITPINGMVHLAGISYISPIKAIVEKKYLDVLRINTFAGFEIAKALVNRKMFQGQQMSIVFISSVYALVGSAANAGYAMSKSALHGLTKSLAVELAPKKVRVNCIAPGFVKTNMMNDNSILFNDNYNEVINNLHLLGLGEPEDIANACAFLLSDAGKWITGSIISVDGGFTAN